MTAIESLEAIEINSLEDMLRIVTYNHPNGQATIFRGQSNFEWDLLPGLYRNFRNDPTICEDLMHFQGEAILQEFLRLAEPYLLNTSRTPLIDLIVAQHYGVPTRLLDWTTNPLVALFFAVETEVVNGDSAFFCAIPNRRMGSSWDLVSSRQAGFATLTAVQAPNLDARITAQSSVFTIYDDGNELTSREGLVPPNWDNLAPRGDLMIKYRVPSKSRQRMFQQLRQCGIDRSSLFPGLGGIGMSIRDAYSRHIIGI